MALLELTLYRAGEAEAQFSPFSPRPILPTADSRAR